MDIFTRRGEGFIVIKKKGIIIISIIIIVILSGINIFKYKSIININSYYKINKEEYINLVSQANIDLFLYDTSNILNNIQGGNEVDSDITNNLVAISSFYKDLLNKFTNINPPKELKKNNELLIISIKNCIKDLEEILYNKENLKDHTINFMKNNEELIKILEEISSSII